MEILDVDWGAWADAGLVLGAALLVGLVAAEVLSAILIRIARRTRWTIDEGFVRRARGPFRLLAPLMALQTVLPQVRARVGEGGELLAQVLSLLLIGGVAWLVAALLNTIEEHVESTHRMDVADNLEARRLRTQATVLKRVLLTFVVVIAVGAALMTFPRVRQLGTSLLASAGILGLALGIAARPVLENLIAGLQLALTQPVRLDDVVVVDGEWGRIEEITSTYVVVRVWDERRLIVPFGRFISSSFENWTRKTADILGTVTIHVDWTVPVQAVRDELERVVGEAQEWDGRVCKLQVTEASEHTLGLRALVSAADSGKAWELRCRVREALVGYLQREHPGALPRARLDLAGRNPGDGERTDEA